MLNDSHKLFETFVRTKHFWQSRLRNTDERAPVHISMNEIKERFFSNPQAELKLLVDERLIEVSHKETKNGHQATFYKALQPGGINPSLLKPKGLKLDSLTTYMREVLKLVSLPEDSISTLYFDVFLKLKETNIELFFTVDEFSGRVHTPVSSFHREFRSNLLINGQKVSSLDVVTMQPLLLGKILKAEIGENDYSSWINSGEDIYLIIQDKAKLKSRDEAKKRFFEILFSKPNKQLADMFGNANWIEWINLFKGRPFEPNPHTIEKNHSNLAWLLQKAEVKIMRKVWQSLKDNNILFLTVHDEIIVPEHDLRKAEQLFSEILEQEFEYYKLSSKVIKTNLVPEILIETELPGTSPILQQVTPANWDTEITALETFFSGIELPSDPVKLDQLTTITDLPKFIASHLATLKANNGKRTYLPYLASLVELKKVLRGIDFTP